MSIPGLIHPPCILVTWAASLVSAADSHAPDVPPLGPAQASNPVPLWAACGNDQRGFARCSVAYNQSYDKDDPWAYELLDSCLHRLETHHTYATKVSQRAGISAQWSAGGALGRAVLRWC